MNLSFWFALPSGPIRWQYSSIMYHIVRQLKKHESNTMISIILVSPVLSTNNFEEFKINTLRKSVWFIIMIIIIIIIIIFAFI